MDECQVSQSRKGDAWPKHPRMMMVPSSNPSSGYKSRKKNENIKLKRFMHSNIHSSTILIAKTWKQPKCPLTDEQINKMWYIHTVENHPSIEKNVVLPFAAVWMDLENIMLSEMSDKDKYCMTSLICRIWKIIQMVYGQHGNRCTDVENKLEVIRGEGRGNGAGARYGYGTNSYDA